MSGSSHHIVLSFDGGIEIIYGAYIGKHITVFGVQINHGAIVGAVVLKHRIIGKDGFLGYLLDLDIKRCLDDESSFGQSAGSISFFELFNNPLDKMRRFDREGVSAEFDIDTLDDRILDLLFSDISVFVCSIERKIFSSVLVFHIKRISGDSDGERSYAVDEFYDSIIIFLVGQV